MTDDRNIWMIYGRDGITERVEVHELEHHSEWMEDSYITVTVKSPVPVMFKYGDFLEYRGEKYYIDYDPKKIQKARKNSYGEAFVYENVKMYHESHVLKDVLFKDYVLNDNGKAYSQQAKFSFFAESVEDLADRIQANLNKAYGENVWIVLTPDSSRDSVRHNGSSAWSDYYDLQGLNTGLRDVNISCDGISCKDALRLAYDQFGLSYVIIEKVIIIGGNNGIDLSGTLEYGKGKGLYELEKNTDETQQLVTKMYAYGSSENMPLNYYANIGRTAKATIACGSKREIIEKNKELVLWVAKSWDLVKSAFGSNLSVTLEKGNMKVHANVSCGTYTYAKEKDDDEHGLDHTTQYLYFWLMESDGQDAVDFYEALKDGGLVNITSGANVNALPSGMVSTRNDYPSLLSIQNLMLPGFPDISLLQWVLRNRGTGLGNGKATWNGHTAYFSNDAKNPWIKSVNADKIGEREGAVYFDGSNSDCENIHPTIKDTGADVVSSGSSIADNGYLAEGTDLSFNISAVDISEVVDNGFDWGEAWANADEDIYVNMTSGYCVGRAFKLLSRPKKVGGSWKLKLERAYDSSLQRYFPYQDTATDSMYAQVAILDKFVVTGTQMSSSLVNAASIKLLKAALEALEEMDHPKVTYIPRIDEIEAARERDTKPAGTSLYDTIRAGLRLTFKDTTDGESNTVTQYIDSLTIKENGNNGVPTYDVVLRDEKELTLQQRLRNQVESMSGSGNGKSSSGGSSAEKEPVSTGGDSLMPLLFELHKKEDEEDTVVDPSDWRTEMEDDDDRDDKLLSVKVKRGLWTDFFMSALGIGSGGGGGAELNEPLYSINEQELGYPPVVGTGKIAIVYNYETGQYEWGKTGGGLSGLTLMDGNDQIRPISSGDDGVTYNLGGAFLSLAHGGIVSGNVTISGASLDITARPDGFDVDKAAPTTVLTKGETETLFDGKFVTVNWFKKLFTAHSGNSDVEPNNMEANITDIEAMFGFWTEQYISALGKGSSSGDGVELYYLLNKLNNTQAIQTDPSDGQTLVWKGSAWTFGNSGMDETALASYLTTNKYIKADNNTKWWGRTMTNNVVKGDIEDADDIYINKGKSVFLKGSVGENYDVFHMSLPSGSYAGNELLVGYGLVSNSYNKYYNLNLYGSIIKHQHGVSSSNPNGFWTIFRETGHVTVNANDVVDAGNTTRNIFLNVGGSVKANRIYLYTDSDSSKDVYLEYIDSGTNKGVHLVGDGFWTDHFVSALGTGTTSGNIFDLDPLLNSLHSSGLNPSVQGEQVLVNTNGSWSWEPYGGGGSGGSTDIPVSWWGAPVTTVDGSKVVKGNMTNVGDITFEDSGKNIGGMLYFNTASSQLKVASNADVVALKDDNASFIPKFFVDGIIATNSRMFAQDIDLYGENNGDNSHGGYIDFHFANKRTVDYTSRIIEDVSGVLKINNTLWAKLSGNVGIGTSNPTAKLDVRGNALVDGRLDIGSNNTFFERIGWVNNSYTDNEDVFCVYSWNESANQYRDMLLGTYVDSIQYGGLYFDGSSWSWGIGTKTPQYKLDVNGSLRATRFYLHKSDGTTGDKDVYLEYSATYKGVHVVGGGLYADEWISALGQGTSSTPFDLNTLLNSLNGTSLNPAEQSNKVLVNNNGTWSWQEYGGGGGVSDDYLPLIIPGSGKTVSMPSIGALTFKSSASDYPLIRFEGKTSGGLGFIGIGKTGDTIAPYFVTTVNGVYVDSKDNPNNHSQWYTLLHTGNLTTQLSGKITNDMLAGSIANSKLANKSITIDGTSVDLGGTFTSSKWGPSRNVTIKDYDETHSGEAVSVDGSGAFTLKLPSTIKASLTGNAATATKLSDTAEYKAWGQTFFISGKPKAIGNDSSHASLNYVSSITMSGNIYQKSTTLVRGTVPANRTVMAHAWQDKNSKNLGWLEFVAEAQGGSSTSSVVNHVGLFILGQHSGDNAYGGLIIQKTVGNTDNRSVVFDANTGLLDTNTIKANRFYLYKPNADDTNAVYFVKDSTGVRLVNAGFYADGFVSALGTGSGGGGGSFDEDTMWSALQNGYGHSIGSTNSYLSNIFAINGNFSVSLKVNGSKVLTSADLDDYLPKTGGTLTGQLTVKANLFQPFCVNSTHASTDATCIQFGHTKNDAFTDYGGILMDSANGYLKRYTSGVANSYTILDSGNYTSYFTDTKNTAGASQKQSTKMYLVGTASFNQNYAVTNINGNCYIDTDNCLYSNGSKVLTSAGGTLTGALTVSSGNTGESINVRTTKTYACITYGQSSGDNWSVGSNSSNQFYFYNSNKAKVVAYITRDGDIYSNGSKVLTSANISGYLSDNLVTTSGDQTIGGAKTFSNIVGIGGSNNSGYRLKVVYNTVTESSITYNRGLLATGLSKFDYIGINTDPVTGKRLKVNGDTLLEGNLSVGTSNTGYNFYVDGTSYLNGIVTVNGISNHPSAYQTKYDNSKLRVSGNAFIYGTVHALGFDNISDMRQKTVTSYVSDLTVEDVARAPIFNFMWKYFADNREHVGTSAQYWLTKLPNVVDGGGDESLSMDYSATALAAAVMTARKVLTHEEEIARLKRTVDEQARKIGELEQEVEQLKAA